jgi:hypothetical protein
MVETFTLREPLERIEVETDVGGPLLVTRNWFSSCGKYLPRGSRSSPPGREDFFESGDHVQTLDSEGRYPDPTDEPVRDDVPDKGLPVTMTSWRVLPKTPFTNTPNSFCVKRGLQEKYKGFVELTESEAIFTVGRQMFRAPKTENIWLNVDPVGCVNFLMLQRSPTILETFCFETAQTGFKSASHYRSPPTEVSVGGNPAVQMDRYDFYTKNDYGGGRNLESGSSFTQK